MSHQRYRENTEKKQKVSIMTLVDTAFEREKIHRAGESSLYAAYKANLRN